MKEIKIPPFIDSHIHFVVDGRPVSEEGLFSIGDALVRHGILSAIDMGYKTGIGLNAKKALGNNMEIKTAGYAIYRKGTYGVFLGRGISEINEVKGVVKDIAEAGADFIKIVNSGIVCAKGVGFVTPGGFPIDVLKTICSEAKERGLMVACHANGDEAIRNAVMAGASSIEHGYFISNETLHMMKEMNVSLTPTIFALANFSKILSEVEKRYLEEVIDNHLTSVNYASSIGVRLNVGTDSGSKGVRHGESFFEELRLFQKAGLSFEQILSAACMDEDEIDKGNYLIAKEDFISTKKIEAVLSGGRQML